MANTAIGGFRWVKSRDGNKTAPVELRTVASAYGTGVFRGDPVKLVDDGTIAVCAAGDAIYGIADGVEQYRLNGVNGVKGNYLPASTTYSGAPVVTNPAASVVRVIPARGQIFEGDANTLAATLTAAQTLMFNNCDVDGGAGGSTTTGRSTFVVNNTGGQLGTGTAQIRMLEISTDPLNDVTAANWKVLIQVVEGTEPNPGTATGT